MKINETSLPEMYSKGLYQECNKDLAPNHTDKISDVLFNGATMLLGHAKQKDHPVVFSVNKIDNSLVIAGIIRYFENETADQPGHWNIAWTFNEDDVPEDAQILKLTDPQTHSYFIGYAGEKYGMQFKTDENLITTIGYFPRMLKKWLDENAKKTEEVLIEQDGVFQARVAVENGEKVFAVEVVGETVAKAKDDTAIEK